MSQAETTLALKKAGNRNEAQGTQREKCNGNPTNHPVRNRVYHLKRRDAYLLLVFFLTPFFLIGAMKILESPGVETRGTEAEIVKATGQEVIAGKRPVVALATAIRSTVRGMVLELLARIGIDASYETEQQLRERLSQSPSPADQVELFLIRLVRLSIPLLLALMAAMSVAGFIAPVLWRLERLLR